MVAVAETEEPSDKKIIVRVSAVLRPALGKQQQDDNRAGVLSVGSCDT